MAKKILVCDDDEGVREAVKLILSDYELILVADGEKCLDCLRVSKDIGLVLLDIKMPKINGLDVLAQIKKKNLNIKVIILSAYRSFDIGEEASQLGAFDYLVKPFRKEEVREIVKNCFDK